MIPRNDDTESRENYARQYKTARLRLVIGCSNDEIVDRLELFIIIYDHVSNNNLRDESCLKSCFSLFPKQSETGKGSENVAGL